jgi:ubiquinone/menaquinone biosynthesis C-methylase UbiE
MEHPREYSDTYVVVREQGEEELQRLIVQDNLFTKGMGGILPEQDDPAQFKRVLDIACGPGGWLLETAMAYPHMSLFGVDSNARFIAYAQSQVEARHLTDVTFRTMDATLMLEFPRDYFDLVTMRLGSSFLRTWDWGKLLSEMARVTRRGGVIRVVDADIASQTNSPALEAFFTLLVNAFYQSGHLFEAVPGSLTARLPALMKQHTGSNNIQIRMAAIENRAQSPYCKDVAHLLSTIRPFLSKWGQKLDDQLVQRVLAEMQQPDFLATIIVHTVWGNKAN